MQEIKHVKVMKMLLLIVSSLLLLSNCESSVSDNIRIDDYEFHALYKFGREIKITKNVDVIYNIKNSKKIKGPVIGINVKTMILINKSIKGDTLKIIIYGEDNKYFCIDKEYYQAKRSIISK